MSDSIPVSLLGTQAIEASEEQKSSTKIKLTLALSQKYDLVKKDIDIEAAQISLRNDKITYVNDIISEITSLIDVKKDELDLSNQTDLLERIRVAKEELKVKLPENFLKLGQLEQNNFISNLKRAADMWHKENQSSMSKIEATHKTLEYVVLTINNCAKTTHQTGLSIARAARGG